jgi:hypothetical protein
MRHFAVACQGACPLLARSLLASLFLQKKMRFFFFGKKRGSGPLPRGPALFFIRKNKHLYRRVLVAIFFQGQQPWHLLIPTEKI